jgi:hypothetical protein
MTVTGGRVTGRCLAASPTPDAISTPRALEDNAISCYVNQVRPLEVHDSALKRGYTEDDIRHVPGRIVLHYAKKDAVIHCMKAPKSELDKALRVTRGR